LRTDNFDPLAYIENAFLDTKDSADAATDRTSVSVAIPSIKEYISGNGQLEDPLDDDAQKQRQKFRKTVMSAPRPRRAKQNQASNDAIDPALSQIWQTLPKSVEFLCSFYDDSVTANYYRGSFKESRQDLIRRLLDPELSLEETSRLLGVCPATVRRYTNRGWLMHHRTGGGQRRFRLSDIVKFVDDHGRFPEE
jgi:excisionase family DNA binding protein